MRGKVTRCSGTTGMNSVVQQPLILVISGSSRTRQLVCGPDVVEGTDLGCECGHWQRGPPKHRAGYCDRLTCDQLEERLVEPCGQGRASKLARERLGRGLVDPPVDIHHEVVNEAKHAIRSALQG